MSHQELQVLFDGAGAEELADRLIDFVESDLEGEATASPHDPSARDWPGDELAGSLDGDAEEMDAAAGEIDDGDLEGGDDEDSTEDAEEEPDDDLDETEAAIARDDLEDSGGFLVTLSRSCFEPSGDLSLDDVELRIGAFLEWLDEETKHAPNVRVDLWVGPDADGAQALEELDTDLLLEMLETGD